METSEQPSSAKRERPAPPLPTTLSPSQEPVPDNTHAPRSPVVLDALPDGIVVDKTMKNLIRWNEALRDDLRLKDQEATDVDERPKILATKASVPVLQPRTNADKQVLLTDQQQVQIFQQQRGEIKVTSDAHTKGIATTDESPVMHMLRAIQQQQVEMQATFRQQIQQLQANMLAALHKQNQEHQASMLAALE